MRTRRRRHSALHARHAAALALSLLLPVAAAADQGAASADVVEELKSPPAPALVVLGLAPTTIDRPQGVRAIVASIVAASKDTGFPRNYSVEISPYWLGTPTLSFDEYYRNSARNLYRYLSTSVAMTPLEAIDAAGTTGTAIGIGARTLLLAGRAHPRLAGLRADLATKQRALNALTSLDSRRSSLIELLQAAQTAASRSLVGELEGASFDTILAEMAKLRDDIIILEISMRESPSHGPAGTASREAEGAQRAAGGARGEDDDRRPAEQGR